MKHIAAIVLFDLMALTAPDGGQVWMQSEHIVIIRLPDHHCPARSSALVRLDNNITQCVMETPNEIIDKAKPAAKEK